MTLSTRALAAVVLVLAAAPLSAQRLADCSTGLAVLLSPGMTPDPARYQAGSARQLLAGRKPTSSPMTLDERAGLRLLAQRTRTGTRYSLVRTDTRAAVKAVDCQAAGAETTCWKCAAGSDGGVHCWQVECPDIITSKPVDPSANAARDGQPDVILGSSGRDVVHTAGVTDPATLRVLKAKRPGPGEMTIEVAKGSALADGFRFDLMGHHMSRHYVIRLTDAMISQYQHSGSNAGDPIATVTLMGARVLRIEPGRTPEIEQVSLSYQKIDWRY